jgi:hypothetical protein
VVHRRSHLALAVAYGLYGTLRARATCLLIDVVDRGLLVALFTHFLTSLGILLGTLDCSTGRRQPTVARCQSKSCRLGMVGGNNTPFFSSALGGTNRRVEASQRCPVMHVISTRPC